MQINSEYVNSDSHAKQKLCCFSQVGIAKCSRVTFYRRNLQKPDTFYDSKTGN